LAGSFLFIAVEMLAEVRPPRILKIMTSRSPTLRLWRRTRLFRRITGVLAAATAAIAFAYGEVAQPGSSIDYGQRAMDFVRSLQPAGNQSENAWPLIEKALRTHQEVQDAARDPGDTPDRTIDYESITSKDEPETPDPGTDPDIARLQADEARERNAARASERGHATLARRVRSARSRFSARRYSKNTLRPPIEGIRRAGA
jgi:hypothetical protein